MLSSFSSILDLIREEELSKLNLFFVVCFFFICLFACLLFFVFFNRRRWDPKLVSKELDLLDQSISMFNFVRVCAFCAQFFDPDFPDGIASPRRELEAPTSSSALFNFFDSRYPSTEVAGQFMKDPRVLESRSRARRAVLLHHAQQNQASDSNS